MNRGKLKRCYELGYVEEVLRTRVCCRGVMNEGMLKRCCEWG
jgi:hypothetical protein